MPTRLTSRHRAGHEPQSNGGSRQSQSGEQPIGMTTVRFSKYRLVARLGSGGMADVYLAVAAGPGGFNKLQVLKILKPDLGDQERGDFFQMFQDEGRLAARLNHPNIVQSYEVGGQDTYDFIVMEYLEGQPLSRIQERTWAAGDFFPLEFQLHILSQMLEGLEYAHTLTDYDGTPLHIVHRDISPQNVFITYSGHTKLVDFGIAKTLESSKTRAGVVKGKVPYMSPEQVLAGHIDHRADLFSVGVMLWEAIARRHMHGTATVYEVLRRLVHGDLPRIRDVVPDVPVELEQILARALALRPDDRYPDAAAFRDDLGLVIDRFRKVGSREIGERVSTLFSEDRRQINEVIRVAMAQVRERDSDPDGLTSVPSLPTLRVEPKAPSFVPGRVTQTAPTTVPMPPHATTPPPVAETMQTAKARRAPRSPLWLLAGVGGVALVALVTTAVVLRRSNEATSERSALTSSPTPPAPLTSIRVNLRAVPDSAALVLDGHMLGTGAYEAQHARDDQKHELEVRAPGFHPRTLPLRFTRDIDLEVRLAEVSAAALPGPNSAAPPAPKLDQPASPVHQQQLTGPAKAAVVPKQPRGPRSTPKAEEAYGEFPKTRPSEGQAPPLDTSSPW